MLWSKFVAALAFVPCLLAKPVVHQHHHISHRSLVQKRAAGDGTYSVVSGDTGYKIAAAYSTTFSALSSANPNVNWNNLQIGQSIKMPSTRAPTVYTTVTGDTQSNIAQKFNIYADDLNAANDGVNWPFLRSGTVLRVPGYGACTKYTVVGGDTGIIIAKAYSVSYNDLSNANPGVVWTNLRIGQVLNVPAGVSPTRGSIPTAIAPSKCAASVTTTMAATTSKASTTTSLVLNPVTTSKTTTITAAVTSKTSTTISFVNSSSPTSRLLSTSSSVTTISVRSTATTSSPTTLKTSSSTTTSPKTTTTTVNTATGVPTVTPTATVTGANYVAGGNNNDGVSSRADKYVFYQGDGSEAKGWPAKSQWISFSTMWKNISPYLGQSCTAIFGPDIANNSPAENQYIYNAIQTIASNSGVDHRLILATIIQESSGCVRVKTTTSPDGRVSNPGLMQTYNGSGSCNKDGKILNPCPASQIYQMISDGTFGTSRDGGKTYDVGLVQDINKSPTYSGAQVIYRATRIYNSGSIDPSNDLGAGGATKCYASDMANRLMGWIAAARTCNLDR